MRVQCPNCSWWVPRDDPEYKAALIRRAKGERKSCSHKLVWVDKSEETL